MTNTADGPISRTLRLLAIVCQEGPLPLSAVAARVELPPPTVLRFLRIMRDCGFLVQEQDRSWRATTFVFRLGRAAIDKAGWVAAVDRVLRDVATSTGESVVYSMYEDGWSIYVAQAESTATIRTHIPVGSRYRAGDTMTGRCMLAWQDDDELNRVMSDHWGQQRWQGQSGDRFRAELAEVRQQGFASGLGETWTDLWGIAVPVLDRFGELIGALGLSTPAERRPDDSAPLAAELIAAGRQLVANGV